MDMMLSFMDKIYENNTMVAIIYVVGAVLLLVLIILLVISLKKPKIKKKEEQIDTKKDTESVNTDINLEKTDVNNTETELKSDSISNTETKTDTSNALSQALSNIEIQSNAKESEPIEEKVDESKLAADIPNVDDYVDNIVKKTYEKNEQFSSVYNTTNIKLDDVADKLNIDKDVQEVILPAKEESDDKVVLNIEPKVEETKEGNVEVPKLEETKNESSTVNSLDLLKNKLEEKKNELSETTTINQEDLKAKLASLNKTEEVKEQEVVSPEDLLKKLNSMKEK